MIKRNVLRIFIIRLILEILLSVVSINTPVDKEVIVTFFIILMWEQV